MLFKSFDPKKYESELKSIFDSIFALDEIDQRLLRKILSKYPKDGDKVFSKDNLVRGFEYLKEKKLIDPETVLPTILIMKPTRTLSGVTTVTVLTKPYPCPGKCIFCPNDVRMPKSYIANEPGAQRALNNKFNPYFQAFNRLTALKAIGHPTEKIELIILGGTWSYYPGNYQRWFIKECFRALNDFGSNQTQVDFSKLKSSAQKLKSTEKMNKKLREEIGETTYNALISTKSYKQAFKDYISKETRVSWEDLFKEQQTNERTVSRCVGLVLETRPDTLNAKQVLSLRRLGATKIQIGVQTLDEGIGILNRREETKAQISKAFKLLRSAGFKIHAHIMPNLHGATPERDLEVYKELFESPDFKPDELKIYPTSIIANTELHALHKAGDYTPYDEQTLIDLLADFMEITPEYCRLTRVMRDIPSTEIKAGNKRSNLREVVEQKLKQEDRKNENIRAREIRDEKFKIKDLKLDIVEYETSNSTEYFLQFITNKRKIAGFLRLSIPHIEYVSNNPITSDLDGSAIIREIHVYGPSLEIDKDSSGEAQHIGLGTKLIEQAKKITHENGFTRLTVISSIGTREYYRKKGFKDSGLYQNLDLE